MHGARTRQFDGRFIAVVTRVEHDHFIAGTNHCMDRRKQGLRRTAGHGHFDVGIDTAAIECLRLGGNRMAQCRNSRHRRILVLALAGMPEQRLMQRCGPIEIGKALPQIDRTVLRSQLGYDREDGRTDLGELAVQSHGRVRIHK